MWRGYIRIDDHTGDSEMLKVQESSSPCLGSTCLQCIRTISHFLFEGRTIAHL